MQIPLEENIKICLRELKARVGLITFGFIVISLVTIVIGWTWPRMYESTITILADQGRLAGRTLGDNVQDASEMVTTREASELMFSRHVLDRVLEAGGWNVDRLSEAERETLQALVRERSNVSINGNLLKISFADGDPQRAFKVVSEFAQQFIRQSAATSLQASRETYEFVDEQVKAYHAKLTEAEDALKNFRSSVIDASPERRAQSFANIETLERNLRQTELALKEAQIAKSSIEEQIAAEEKKSTSSSTADLYRRRLQEMRDQLDILRLSYHDSYPDIVSLKKQIEDMKLAIDQENDRHLQALARGDQVANANRGFSPLYESLRNSLAAVTTEIRTHQTRISEFQDRLVQEKLRAQKMGEGEAQEEELVRDYEVNQEYYQNLLRRRENARLSMNLALQDAGLSYKVQEKANLPQVPKGLRFIHFVLAGPLLGLGMPIAFFVLLVQIDPRIRSVSILEDDLELPVLGIVPPVEVSDGLSARHYSLISGAVVGVGLAYAVIIVMRLGGEKLAQLFGG